MIKMRKLTEKYQNNIEWSYFVYDKIAIIELYDL